MASWYISPSAGNDTTGAGTLGNPYKTITKCEAVATLNDEVVIIDGTHTLTANDAPTLAKIRTIRSQGGNPTTCVIDGNNAYYIQLSVSAITAATFYFKDFTYKNNINSAPFVSCSYSAHTVNIRNMIFDTFRTSTTYGIFLWNMVGGTFDIRNCVFKNPPSNTSYLCMTGGGTYAASTTINLINNVFYYTTYYVQYFITSAGANSSNNIANFKNNIIFNGHSTVALYLFYQVNGNGTNNLANIYNNDLYNSIAGTITNQSGTNWTVTASGGITTNPLFVDGANGDFRLQVTPTPSPCINTGTP